MAYTPCTTAGLGANIASLCDVARIKGYEQLGVIFKKSDIDLTSSTVSSTNPRNLTLIALLSGKKTAVIYNSKKNPLPFGGTQTAYNRDADAYDKTVQFYFEGIGGDASKQVVEPLKADDYVVVLERKDKRGNGSFQVFGWQNGVSAGNDGGAQVQDEETGYWLITMTGQEPWAEICLDGGDDYDAAKSAFDTLKALAV